VNAAILLALLIAADPAKFFDSKIAPILTRRCLACHNNQLKDGEISFEDRASLLKGGGRGPAIVPGEPERSILIQAIKRKGELKMPPGPPLRPKEIARFEEWIRDGAAWGTKLGGAAH
jgi:hypothetical protein